METPHLTECDAFWSTEHGGIHRKQYAFTRLDVFTIRVALGWLRTAVAQAPNSYMLKTRLSSSS